MGCCHSSTADERKALLLKERSPALPTNNTLLPQRHVAKELSKTFDGEEANTQPEMQTRATTTLSKEASTDTAEQSLPELNLNVAPDTQMAHEAYSGAGSLVEVTEASAENNARGNLSGHIGEQAHNTKERTHERTHTIIPANLLLSRHITDPRGICLDASGRCVQRLEKCN